MPHNWTITAPRDAAPPVIRASADGALYAQLGESYGVVGEDEIAWVSEETALVSPGEDAYPALELFFRHTEAG